MRDQLTLAPHESSDDAIAAISELAMKRAASFGRGPVLHDVEIAASLLGYVGDVDPDFAVVAGAGDPRCRPRVRRSPRARRRRPRRSAADAAAAAGAARRGSRRAEGGPRSLTSASGSVRRLQVGCTSGPCALRCSTGSSPRHHGGTFILRIEDTDASRTTEEAVIGITDALGWLGLDWDEGPIRQSTRLEEHRATVARLVAGGHAYECFCTADELAARNDDAKAAGRPPGYDGHCRDLTADDRAAFAAEGRTHVVRFRTPDDGVSTFVDAIRGEVTVEWRLIRDFVIQRADGTPIFFLANAVDDIDMGITHVIRGEDLLDSTHRVLALRRVGRRHASGVRPPAAHRRRRDARQAVEAPRCDRARGVSQGGLPPGSPDELSRAAGMGARGSRQRLTRSCRRASCVAAFDLDHVTHAAAAFDRKKLDWMNGEWIRRLALDELVERVEPMAHARFGDHYDHGRAVAAIALAHERAVTLNEIVDGMAFLFVADADFVDRT